MDLKEKLDLWFREPIPCPEVHREAFTKVRLAAWGAAVAVVEACPPGADLSATLRKLREAQWTAQAAILLGRDA